MAAIQLASSLGIGYLTLARYDDAERIFRKNYDIEMRVFGPNRVETISTRNNLAALYRETGRLEEALPHYEASARAAEKIYGPEHPESLRFQGNLGSTPAPSSAASIWRCSIRAWSAGKIAWKWPRRRVTSPSVPSAPDTS